MKSSLRPLRALVCSLAICVLLPSQAFAQKKVLLLAAEDPAWVADVKAKLVGTSLLTGLEVDVIDVRAADSTPTLPTLLGYDAVLTWADFDYGAPDALGDVLADYVDLGHGVVQAVFSFDSTMPTTTLGGRWRAQGYGPFNFSPTSFDSLTLVADLPQHEILGGVASVATSNGFFQMGVVVAGCAEVVAHWSNGEPLVAWCPGQQGGRVVAMNMYPPSSDVFPLAWLAGTDGGRLMANALVFAGSSTATAPNRPPTANAGAPQTLEAIGPAGAPFILTGSGSDPDGDPLTLTWSGAAAGSGPVLTGTLAPPAAPAKSQSYTITLTVSDGNGGVATDAVVVTVTDTTGPVLANVPASPLTAVATGDGGANVPYGPVTATDAVDGARPVVCSKSGVFPIGDTLVTCSSTDTRGNSAGASFTVRVTDVTTPGAMVGLGLVRTGGLNYEFDFGVRERMAERARLEVHVTDVQNHSRNRRDDRFRARTTDFVAFSDDPTVRPGRSRRPQVDTVLFTGAGDWNGRAGYRYEVFAVDRGDFNHYRDSVRITIKAPNGLVVASVEGTLTRGFVESERLRR